MGKSSKIFIIIVIMILELNWHCDCCFESERIGLLEINSVFKFSKGYDLKGDCCDWATVGCSVNTGHVTSLQLNGLIDFNWYLNASLFLPFQQLNELYLYHNNISGFVPHEGFDKLSTLTNLETLDLSYNIFKSKNFLRSIGKLRSLKSLYLDECGLGGSISSFRGLCQMKHLQELSMSGNKFNSNLPQCLRNLTSLRFLDLSSNQVSGSISLSSLGTLASLESLYLSNNPLRIPTSLTPLFNLSRLKYLDVDNNMLYSDTEYRDSNPKFQLEVLYMHGYSQGNGEGGPIPEFLHHQHSLQVLEISNVGLRGRFPCWLLANNTSLRYLYLTNNLLSGDLQLPTKPHVSLDTLNISDNFFSGHIPSQIGVFFPSLGVISMSGNEFNGSLPKSLCNYVSSLRELDISHSYISGALPKCIGNMTRLEILNLSNNNISGTLPSKFRSFHIAIVYLSKNRLHGSLKEAFHNCSSMWILDLSYNNFSGSIPPWIQTLPNLEYLILGYNNFQGKIPVELCQFKRLSFLDLSHNDISGHIPSCLNTTSFWSMVHGSLKYGELELGMKGSRYVYQKRILQFISGIDISCNNLVGRIPNRFGNLSGIQVLNLSHNNLIGGIPMTFSNLKEIESLDLSFNNLQGPIPRQLNQLTSLEVFNVSYNNLSGETPDRVAQFATFDESCYKGNPFLCGWPLSKSCFTKGSPPSNAKISPNKEESEDALIDMEMFYVSFGVTYVVVLLTLVVILCINPYWRRFWFYHVQMSIDKPTTSSSTM